MIRCDASSCGVARHRRRWSARVPSGVVLAPGPGCAIALESNPEKWEAANERRSFRLVPVVPGPLLDDAPEAFPFSRLRGLPAAPACRSARMEGLEPANDDRRTTFHGGDYASASPGARSGQRILLAEAHATQTAPGDGVISTASRCSRLPRIPLRSQTSPEHGRVAPGSAWESRQDGGCRPRSSVPDRQIRKMRIGVPLGPQGYLTTRLA